ncbi:MAG: DJ-1/PfpI family protein [Candidatus Micrarchaeia archaeon]
MFLVFIAPNNFKDENLAAIKLFLERWKLDYKIASYSKGECKGYHGAIYRQDISANKIAIQDYEGIILVDGQGIDEYKLYEYRPLLDLLMQFNNYNKNIIAIGNSVKLLARANIVQNKKVVVSKNDELRRLVQLFHGIPSETNMEFAGNIITMDGSNINEQISETLKKLGKI